MVTKKKRCQVTIDWNMSHWEGRCTCGKNWRGTSLVRLRSLAKGHTCEGMKIKVGDNPWSTVKDKNGKIILRGNQKYLSVTKAIGKKKPVRSDSVREKKTTGKKFLSHPLNINSRVIIAETKMRAYIGRGKPANMTMAQYKQKIATLERAWIKAKNEEQKAFERMWDAGYNPQEKKYDAGCSPQERRVNIYKKEG